MQKQLEQEAEEDEEIYEKMAAGVRPMTRKRQRRSQMRKLASKT